MAVEARAAATGILDRKPSVAFETVANRLVAPEFKEERIRDELEEGGRDELHNGLVWLGPPADLHLPERCDQLIARDSTPARGLG